MTKKNMLVILGLLAALMITGAAGAFPAPAADPFPALEKKLESLVKKKDGMHIGLAFCHVEKGSFFSMRGDELFPLASVFKVPLLVAVLQKIDRKEASLSSQLVIHEHDKCIGSGSLQDQAAGSKVTVERAMELMITVSDNTATDILWEFTGTEAVSGVMPGLGLVHNAIYLPNRPGYLISLGLGSEWKGKSAGQIAALWGKKSMEGRKKSIRAVLEENRNLTRSRFQAAEDASAARQTGASYYDDVAVAKALDNMCSPADMARLLEKLFKGEILSRHSTALALGVLSRTKFNTRIPGNLPSSVKVFHKTGTICGIVNDAGIIEVSKNSHAVLVVFICDIEEGRAGEAGRTIAQIARMVYDSCPR
ncbi:MAG: serine hydrolase [Candidatus Eremiobacteraeota bacterium]|nr:serine hydrolase [Candidatus Eremiobacteraeota bacterium]